MIPTTVRVTALLGLLVVAATSGCGLAHLHDLNFRVDTRLEFLSPRARSLTAQPVTISWRMSGFRVEPFGSHPTNRDSGYFAVFVDRTPIRPGQTMEAVAGGGPACDVGATCPGADLLAEHQVFTTTSEQMVFPPIANLSSTHQKVQMHTFTVVLMDSAGHRIGESSWELDLRIPRSEAD